MIKYGKVMSVSVDRKVKALVNAGYYSSELKVIIDAIRSLFRENSELKVNVPIFTPVFSALSNIDCMSTL